MSTLKVVITSTRPGRIGGSIAHWVVEAAQEHGGFDTFELLDLAEFDLPMFDEPSHPRLGQYERAHTRAWSQAVDGADALIFVHPEYNHFPPPSLINAIDYLHAEWRGQPVGFVSYGGASGGGFARAALIPLAEFLSMRVAGRSFGLEWAAKQIADGRYVARPDDVAAATSLVDELRESVDRADLQDEHAA